MGSGDHASVSSADSTGLNPFAEAAAGLPTPRAALRDAPRWTSGLCRSEDSAGRWSGNRWSVARYSYRYFSESASACSMSAIVSSGIRSWASVTSAEVGWASADSHWSGFQAPLRRSALGQCG